jgi:hypothetical protein
MTVEARISLASVVHQASGGVFPAMQTYPARYEDLVTGEDVKLLPAVGVVGEEPITLAVPDAMSKVTYLIVENLAALDEEGEADVAVTGGPLPATIPRGQVILATNAIVGWDAEPIVISGTVGTPFKVIVLGR